MNTRSGTAGGALRRLATPRAWTPAGIALAAVVLGGLVLRLVAMGAVRPISYGLYDSGTYLSGAVGDRPGGLFYDVHHPVGYSFWLRAVGWVIDTGTQLAVIQHALGMAAGILLWFALRRLGAHWVLATVGAAAVLLNAEVVQLEHSIMSEALYIPVLVGAFSLAIYAATSRGWPAIAFALGAGLFAGTAYTARYPGLLWLPIVAVLPLLLAPLAAWRGSILKVVVVGVGGLAVLFPYLAVQDSNTGLGLKPFHGSGWAAYSVVAPYADCKLFTPPRGTRKLCDKTPVGQRETKAEYYTFGGESPATDLEPRGYPYSDDKFAAFAAAAAPTVTKYTKPTSGLGAQIDTYFDALEAYTQESTALSPIAARNPAQETYEATLPSKLFDLAPIGMGSSAATFDDVKGVLRIHGWWILVGFLVTAVALVYARRFRLATLACWVFVAGNWVAAGGYNPRYAVPISIVAVLAIVLALSGIAARAGADRPRTLVGRPADGGGW